MQISALTSASYAYAQNQTGITNTLQDSFEQSPIPTQNETLQTSGNESEDIFNITASQKVEVQPTFKQEVPDENVVIEKPELEEREGPSELINQVTNKSIIGPEPGTDTEIFDFEMNTQNVSVHEYKDTAAVSIVKQTSLGHVENNIKRIHIGDFRIFKNSLVCPPQDNSASCPYAFPREPVAANNGRNVFFAGNVFAARSNDGGDTWQYVNPQDHGRLFCCDQDIIYSSHYDIFIWYLQGAFASPAGSGPGYSTVAVSRDLNNWWYYNIPSTLFGQERSSQWFDFPHIALSDNNFYFTTIMHRQEDGGVGEFEGNLVSRWDLRAMSNAQPVAILYIINPEAGVAPVQGATNIMYFGTNNVCEPGRSGCVHSNHLLKVLRWDEQSPNIESRVIDIIPWQPTIDEAPDCPTPDSTVNFCSAIVRVGPNAVSGGWVLNGAVGFVWNSNQGPGFPHMYINGAILNANDLSYNHRLLLWDERGAFMQAHVAVSQGRLALAAYYGDSTRHPTVGVALFANNDIRVPGFVTVMDGQVSTALGDYLRVRPYSGTGFLQGSGPLWIGSGYTRMTSGGQAYDQSFYYIFGIEGPAGNPFIRNTAPDCTTATPSQSVLWPPNHEITGITIQNIIDQDGDPLTVRITSIRQDEPTRGQGMGDQSPDGFGIGTSTAQVRAERAGNGDGRVYHISFTTNDGRGAECTGEVLVSVPHDQRGAPARDSGARFDSTQ